MTRLAFLPIGDPQRPIAWRHGHAISRAQFLYDVARLHELLPEVPYVLNHCEDRYHFLVGLAAALLRGQVSLFPSSRAPQVLEQLAEDFAELYCLTDQADEAAPLKQVRYPADASTAVTPIDEALLAFPADRLAAIAFTSGSTGQPKRYRKYWGGFVREAQVAGRSLGLDPERPGIIVATVPPQHMYGFITSIMLPCQYGYALGAERPFYPEDIRKVLGSLPRPGILVTTPVHIRACVLDEVALPPLQFLLSSTAPLDGELAAAAEQRYAAPVMEFYGSTETGAIAARRQAQTPVWQVFDEVRVSLDPGGFRVDAGYFPDSIVLGDNVEVRNEKEFLLFGRNTDLVKIGGKRNSLTELNRQLLEIDGVVDGAFFLPDAAPGREPRLAAFVVAPGKHREDILEALRQHVDPVFLPRPLRLVSALPRNETGKLPRGNLLRLLAEEEQREAAG